MLGMSKKGTAQSLAAKAGSKSPTAQQLPQDAHASVLESFRVLELATLALDGIAHALGEARMLARIACRPEGAAQRGLIAARYAFLKEQIEQRSQEAALENSDRVMVSLGGTEDGRQGSLVTRSLPASRFETPEEAQAIVRAMDFATRAIEDEAACLREAAGHIADQLVDVARRSTLREAEAPVQETVRTKAAPVQKGRRAA
jgi:hypothetical protein